MATMTRRALLSLTVGCTSALATGCASHENAPVQSGDTAQEGDATSTSESTIEEGHMQISVTDGEHTVVYQLNDTSAVRSLRDQLPLSVEVGTFSDNEKTFIPAIGLDTSDVIDSAGRVGDIAYFSPWGDVAMYYGHDAGPYQGLYALGQAIEGADQVALLTGTITIAARQ